MIHAVSTAADGWFKRPVPAQRLPGDVWAAMLYVAGLNGFYAVVSFLGLEDSAAAILGGSLLPVLLLSAPRRWWQWIMVTVVVYLTYTAFALPSLRLFEFRTTVIMITLGQSIAQAWLIRWRLRRPVRFERTQDVFVVVVMVAGVCLLSTPLSAWAASSLRGDDDLLAYMRVRWLSHTVTALTLTPFVVTWVIAWRERGQWQWRKLFWCLGLLAGTVAIVGLAILPAGERVLPFIWPAPPLCLLPLTVGAILFRVRGVAAIIVILMLNVMVAVGDPPTMWRGSDVVTRRARAQLLLGIVSAAGLLFGASLAEIDARARLLSESEARYRLALRTSGLGVWRRSLETGATEWDDRMFTIFGLPPTGYPPPTEQILAAIGAEDHERFEHFWRNIPASGGGSHVACRLRWPGGDVRQVELFGIVEQGAAGGPGWIICVANDTTDLVRAAAESESLKARLQQAQKMEALGNLAAGVAHDFNTLLTGINVMVDMASTTLTPSHEAASMLQQARRGSASARVLVQRILNYSRGSRVPTTTTCNVVELVRDTAPLLAAAFPPNISLSVEMQCDEACVQADPSQLQQVIINLSTNAARAIGDRPGKVDIRVERFVAPGTAATKGMHESHVRISVADDGRGMDEPTRARIFDPNFTTQPTGEGTGLGLVIVREIVTAHAGTLEVESSPGKGTIVAVRLPLTCALAA